MNELLIYRTLHSLLAVARVAAECRSAINLVAEATAANGNTPYTVDAIDAAALDCLAALAEALRTLEHSSAPIQRARKRGELGPSFDVSRETRVPSGSAADLDEGFPF